MKLSLNHFLDTAQVKVNFTYNNNLFNFLSGPSEQTTL